MHSFQFSKEKHYSSRYSSCKEDTKMDDVKVITKMEDVKTILNTGIQYYSPENTSPLEQMKISTDESLKPPTKRRMNEAVMKQVANLLENSKNTINYVNSNDNNNHHDDSLTAPHNYATGYVEAKKLSELITQNSPRLHKRIIICCDGTWNNGLTSAPNEVTNVSKLARCIFPEDRRTFPPIPQVVFYQAGLGTTNTLPVDVAQGATGAGMLAKIREAYAFISQNYIPGDEIFLFGFSRGAFTARTIASLIADIGILNTEGMEDFHQVLAAYQVRRRGSEHEADADKFLNNYRCEGKQRVSIMEKGALKCVGVWDTVGAFGMPGFFGRNFNLLGFKDTKLSRHIKYAFHAIALHETRKDFMPTKWVQKSPPRGSQKPQQVLKQVWFSGSHSDVGGGYKHHDLSDITLIWMVANLMEHNLLAIDEDYLSTLLSPQAEWGKMIPTEVKKISLQATRDFPKGWNETTRETFHQSVAFQDNLKPEMATIFKEQNVKLIEELLPFEEKMRGKWDSMRKEKKLEQEPRIESNPQNNIFFDFLKRVHGILDVGRFGLEIVRGNPSNIEEVAQDLLECPGEVAAVAGVDQAHQSSLSEAESFGSPSPLIGGKARLL